MAAVKVRKHLYAIAILKTNPGDFKQHTVDSLLPHALKSIEMIKEESNRPKPMLIKDLIADMEQNINFEELCHIYNLEFKNSPKKVFIAHYKEQDSKWRSEATMRIRETLIQKEYEEDSHSE